MTWLLIILLIPVFVTLYILFAPFYLEADSTKGLLRIRFHRLISASVLVEDSSLIMVIRIIRWSRRIDLLTQKERNEKPFPEKERKRKTLKISFRRIKAIMRSFKINTFRVNLDFEDVELNAVLFPVFYTLTRSTGKDFYINFIGENEIKLEIENNIARVLWAYIFK